MGGYTYIMANKRNGTLYIGVTNDLSRRVWEHKNKLVKGFTSRYKVHTLVWYEAFDRIEDAIHREKQMKEWNRKWKLNVIEERNPTWRDLYGELV